MKYPKAASQFCKVNKEVNTAKINNKFVLMGEFSIDDPYLKKAAFESAVETLKKYNSTISDYHSSKFYHNNNTYYLDFIVKRIIVEDDFKKLYHIHEIAAFRLIGYTEMDMHYNKPASIVYSYGDMKKDYSIPYKKYINITE